MKILLWNVEWATLKSSIGKEIQRIYRDIAPDLARITEGNLNAWVEEENVISSTEDYGYQRIEGRRKVILISNDEWKDVDDVGNIELQAGRYCYGNTHGLDIHGVCIP